MVNDGDSLPTLERIDTKTSVIHHTASPDKNLTTVRQDHQQDQFVSSGAFGRGAWLSPVPTCRRRNTAPVITRIATLDPTTL
jgi:hypothetical protein